MAVSSIDENGITIGTLAEYIEHVEDRYKSSDIYGENIRTGPGSVCGFHATLKGELLSDLAALLAEGVRMGSPYQSVSSFLSENARFAGITRNEEIYSTVSISITAEASGTTVNATNTQISDGAGAAFVPTGETVISASATESVACIATVPGPVVGAAGTLTTIDKRPYGLASATNITDATVGRLVESDPALKARYAQATSVVGRCSDAGVERAIRDLDGVTDAMVYTDQTKYMTVVVEGGTDADVAQLLHRTVAAGTKYNTSGTTTVNYVDDDTGQADTIQFFRVVDKPIYITFVVEKLRGYAEAGGDDLIKQRTVDLFAGELEVEGVNIPRPRIGQYVVGNKISVGADSVDRCIVRAVRINFAPNPGTTDDLSMELWWRATTSKAIINIVEAE